MGKRKYRVVADNVAVVDDVDVEGSCTPPNLTCAVKVLLGEVRERKYLNRDQRRADREDRVEVVRLLWTTYRISLVDRRHRDSLNRRVLSDHVNRPL